MLLSDIRIHFCFEKHSKARQHISPAVYVSEILCSRSCHIWNEGGNLAEVVHMTIYPAKTVFLWNFVQIPCGQNWIAFADLTSSSPLLISACTNLFYLFLRRLPIFDTILFFLYFHSKGFFLTAPLHDLLIAFYRSRIRSQHH